MEHVELSKEDFKDTTNGITDEELKTLTQNQESEHWKITDSRPGRITAKSHNGESTVIVQFYPIENAPKEEVGVYRLNHTTNGGAVSTSGLQLSSKPAKFLPGVTVVSNNDFYAEVDKVADPLKYRGNVVTQLHDDGSLSYDVATWMDDELAKKRKAYDITATWDGRHFKIKRVKLQGPNKD